MSISAIAGGWNDIPQAWNDLKSRGVLEYLACASLTVAAFFSSNWPVLCICFGLTALMFYTLIVEPNKVAREAEQRFVEENEE